jgi:hypothetical protein
MLALNEISPIRKVNSLLIEAAMGREGKTWNTYKMT